MPHFDGLKEDFFTVWSGYSGHLYSGHSDIVANLPGAKYIHHIVFMSDT